MRGIYGQGIGDFADVELSRLFFTPTHLQLVENVAHYRDVAIELNLLRGKRYKNRQMFEAQ